MVEPWERLLQPITDSEWRFGPGPHAAVGIRHALFYLHVAASEIRHVLVSSDSAAAAPTAVARTALGQQVALLSMSSLYSSRF